MPWSSPGPSDSPSVSHLDEMWRDSRRAFRKMVSEILGARDRRFTLQVYGHVSENIRDETTEAFDQMFGDKGTVSGAVVGVVVGPKIQMNC